MRERENKRKNKRKRDKKRKKERRKSGNRYRACDDEPPVFVTTILPVYRLVTLFSLPLILSFVTYSHLRQHLLMWYWL
jgi:hypothetical protein